MKTITQELPLTAPRAESCAPITGDDMTNEVPSQEVIVAQEQPRAVVQQSSTAQFMEMAMRMASDPSIDVDKAERIINIVRKAQREDDQKEERKAFNESFALMQAEIPTIVERGGISTDNGKTIRSKFANFEDIVDGVRPVLSKHGFSVSFIINQDGGQITVTTILRHKFGYDVQTPFVAQSDTSGSKNAIQAIGSTISYAKRYGLCSLLSIATRGEDKDGNTEFSYITTEQAVDIDQRVRALGDEYHKRFLVWINEQGAKTIMDIPITGYKKVITAIAARENEAKKAAEKKVTK